jgi:MoaA/NifB/PqqE/SkfB family radical SAM enzyme
LKHLQENSTIKRAMIMSGSSNLKKLVGITKVAYKIIQIEYFKKKLPIFGSADITNSCNLKCKHCYWWLNRTPHKELSADEWVNVVREKFIKNDVVSISLTGGEPLLRPDVIEAIISEMKWRYVTVVTNGTLPLVDFGVGYFISIDGTESIHDAIRGVKIYRKVKQNVIDHPEVDVVINMTINSLNYGCVEDVVDEWYSFARAFTFQFHTPFSYDDTLWLPYGKTRNSTIDKLLEMKEKYPDFIANTSKQLNLFKDGKWTVNCPKWFFINLDSSGKTKQFCVISNTDENGVKPICERCGIACYAGAYSGLFLSDTEWFRMFKVAKRVAPFKNNNLSFLAVCAKLI